MNEVLNDHKTKILESFVLETLNLNEKEYFIFSIHREENVDNEKILK